MPFINKTGILRLKVSYQNVDYLAYEVRYCFVMMSKRF